ncbi:MAG: hypothetical protein HZA52_09315 [Planctomycetes bacterium]|nr:hypothetical protein [Planctomycetota bacterium]
MHRIRPLAFMFVLTACAAPEPPHASAAVAAPPAASAESAADTGVAVEVVPAAQPSSASEPAVEPPAGDPIAQSDGVVQSDWVVQSDAAARSELAAQGAPGTTASAPRSARRVARTSGRLLDWEQRELARAAFAALTPDEQVGLVEALAIESANIGSFQMVLVRFVLGSEEIDPGLRPDAAPLAWYDAETHAPKQPIPRRVLTPDDPRVATAEREILGALERREAVSGWTYDWGRRDVVRLANERDPWRVFENALLGLPPYWDLAEALVEQRLDDGTYQKVLAAFGHAYTDRVGGVYPNITLYDAYASRASIEMPDVDTLGLVHEVLGDFETWKSIVPEPQHPELFGRLGQLYMPAFHFRGLRNAVARTFVCGSTELRDGYQQHLDNFHALWESAGSDPAALAARLPDETKWNEFLVGLTERAPSDELFSLRGLRRRVTLDQNGAEVRRYLYWLLEQADAYRRIGAGR